MKTIEMKKVGGTFVASQSKASPTIRKPGLDDQVKAVLYRSNRLFEWQAKSILKILVREILR